jgi:excinuclease UvrABC ATPase subunit
MYKYYIYKMTAITEDGTKGCYIGQHKIGKKEPMKDGYKGSGTAWKKYILQQNIPVEKVILRMCDSVEDANYWEQYYIESALAQGIYLWNRIKGSGSHEYDRIYTDEELAEHQKQCNKQYRETNKEKVAEQHKRYREANREKRKQYQKQYRETNKEKVAEYMKQYRNQLCQYNGKTLTLNTLKSRIVRAGIEHPTAEAKKYLI